MSMNPLVDIQHVIKEYGPKIALADISFSIPQGEMWGLLGPNGAGKTTLFRLLMGILKPTKGSLKINALDSFTDRVATKRLVGYLPDEPIFYSYLSGREILQLSAAMHGLDVEASMKRIGSLAHRLNLRSELDTFAEDYSREMKKKLGILLALIHEPQLLILDEPTNGLDVESTRFFYQLMREQSAEGKTILFSTHLIDQVTKLCSHVVILSGGRQVASGSVEEICSLHNGQTRSLEDAFLDITSSQNNR